MATVLDIFRTAAFQPDFTIELEHAGDAGPRERLLDVAMGANRRKKSSEKLRRGRVPAEGLSLVARDRHSGVIGTVRLWNIHAGITPAGAPLPALLLGPLAVSPDHEGKGIGAALMRASIMEARRLGHGAVLLVGDAPYYERFGFFADKTQTLMMPGPFERSRFLALELEEGWLKGAAGMLVASGLRSSQVQAKRAA